MAKKPSRAALEKKLETLSKRAANKYQQCEEELERLHAQIEDIQRQLATNPD